MTRKLIQRATFLASVALLPVTVPAAGVKATTHQPRPRPHLAAGCVALEGRNRSVQSSEKVNIFTMLETRRAKSGATITAPQLRAISKACGPILA